MICDDSICGAAIGATDPDEEVTFQKEYVQPCTDAWTQVSEEPCK